MIYRLMSNLQREKMFCLIPCRDLKNYPFTVLKKDVFTVRAVVVEKVKKLIDNIRSLKNTFS